LSTTAPFKNLTVQSTRAVKL